MARKTIWVTEVLWPGIDGLYPANKSVNPKFWRVRKGPASQKERRPDEQID